MIQFRSKYKLGNIISAIGIAFSLILGVIAIIAGIWLQSNQAPINTNAENLTCDNSSFAACINDTVNMSGCNAGSYNGICRQRIGSLVNGTSVACDCVASTPAQPNLCNTSTDGKCTNKTIGASCGNSGNCLVINTTGNQVKECECRGESTGGSGDGGGSAGECDANCTNAAVSDCGPIGSCSAGQRRTSIRRCDGNGDGVQTNCSDVCVNDNQCGGSSNSGGSSSRSSSRRNTNSSSSQPTAPVDDLPDTGIISPEVDIAIFGVVLVGLGVHLYQIRKKLLINP